MPAVLSSIASDRLTAREILPGQKRSDIFPQVVPLLTRTGACRNLFGPVDHDDLQRELTSKLQEIAERDRLRWNFDFGEGRPLDGELEWEESPAGDCPTFYRERITTAVSKEPKTIAPNCGGRSASPNILNQKNKTEKRNPRKHSKRLTDLRITDFYAKRRRTVIVTPKESRIVE